MTENSLQQFGDYKINSLLGKGGYGRVYKATHCRTSNSYAIKVSDSKTDLYKEYQFLINLQLFDEFPKLFDYQESPTEDGLIMELLGRNLSYRSDETPFTLKCVCAIGIKLLDSIEKIHESGILHRDLKPGNFLVTLDKKNLKIVDFGIATYFKCGREHKEFKTQRKCKGTPTFASINNHLGFRQSRRDDIECWCYSLLYLLTGGLPWKNGAKIKGFSKWKCILNQKISLTKSDWLVSLPAEFKVLLQYVRKLTYEQCPNYLYMKTLLSRYVHLNHLYSYFDWYDIKNDTNLKNSQQIVEGATLITKLKREKKNSGNFQDMGIRIIKKKRIGKNFGSSLKKCLSQDISQENKYFSLSIDRLSSKISKRRRRHLDRKQFLQLPTCDDIFIKNHHTFDHQSKIKSMNSEPNLNFALFESSKSFITLDNQHSVDKDSLTIDIDSDKEEDSNQQETPKSHLPEFKDKVSALSLTKRFADIKHQAQKPECIIY